MNAPKKIWVDGEMVGESGFASCFDEPMGGGYTAYVRADLVDKLVEALEKIAGGWVCVDEAGLTARAALKALETNNE